MNDYIFLICLIVLLVVYLIFLKEKLIKWEKRDSIEKSYSIRLTIILITGIILWIVKIINNWCFWSKTVAEEEFVKDGANKVTESMIQGATMTGAKATEKIIKNN